MFKIDTPKAFKIILLFAMVNSSIFLAYHSSGFIRLIIVVLMNISAILLMIFFYKISKNGWNTNSYFKIMFTLLIIWSFYTILYSFALDSKTLITLFGHYMMGWTWITPLAVVFGFNIFNWLAFFQFFPKWLLLISILALGSSVYSVSELFGLMEWMRILPMFLLTFVYQNRSNKKIIMISLAAYLMLTYFASQRANVLFLSIIFIFFIVEFFRQNEIQINKKIYAFLTLIIISIFLMTQINSYINDVSNDKEMTSDTRSFLFEEMYADMSVKEKFVGRGALGTYYSHYFDVIRRAGIKGGDSPHRISVEVGYLEIVLKGGYVMMFLYLMILLPAAYLGVFKSDNIISRSSGYLIFTYVVLWVIGYYPVYSATYILLWVAVGSAISDSARKTKNSDMLIKTNKGFIFATI